MTTALAVVTLFVMVAFFAQTFRTFLTDHDPVLIAVERVKEKVEQRKEVENEASATEEGAQNGGEATKQTVD